MNGPRIRQRNAAERRCAVATATNSMSLPAKRFAALLALAMAALLLSSTTNAADLYWDGGDGSWNVNTNWSTDPNNATPDPGAVPGATDTAHFNRSGNDNVVETINLGATQSALGLVFTNQSATTLTGGPGDFGINLFSGGITVNSGAGTVTLGAAASPDLLAIVLNANQTWTSNSSNPITINNTVSGAIITALTLDGSSTANNTIAGNFVSGGVASINKNGTGTWVLSGNNTPGVTFVNEGKIVLNRVGGGSVNGVIVGDGVGLPNTAILEFGTDNQLTVNSLNTGNSDGKVDLNGKNQTFGDPALNGFDLNSGNLVNSGAGTIFLGQSSRINSASGTNFVTGGIIDMGGAARVGVTAGTMTVSSQLINGGIAHSAGTLILTNATNNLTVGTSVFGGGVLNINANGAIGTGALSYTAGTIDNTSGNAVSVSPSLTTIANVTFGGTDNLTINGPWTWPNTATRIVSVNGTTGKVTFTGVATPATLSNAFAKGGAGTLELTGNNLWTGITTVRQGTLSIASIANTSTAQPLGNNTALTIGQSTNSATLEYTGASASSNYPITLVNNAAAATQSMNVTNSGTTLTLAGNLTSGNVNQTFAKVGDGTLKLTGTQSYASLTNVNQGTLLLSGTKSGTALITVGNGVGTDTLGGVGSTNSSILVNAGGGVLAPGESIGTLTMTGGADVTLNGKLLIEVSGAGAGSVDLLNTVDVLTITSGTVDFNVLSALNDPAYIFADYSSLVGATFGTVLNLPSGYQLDYNYLGNTQIALVAIPVPEPTAVALMGFAAIGLVSVARRQRRKDS